jgi:soluble lytic murein transglycosylase-like protein
MSAKSRQRLLHGAMALILVAGLAAMAVTVQAPEVEPNRRASSEPDEIPVLKSPKAPDRAVLPEEKRYRILADFLAQRYKVSRDITLDFVRIAHAAGHQIGLDPLLILAVMAVESQFNPIAESVAGAKGLMQVMPKYHEDKLEGFGGEAAVFDPRINILVGTQILKEYLSRAGNNLSTALQMYAGALADEQNVYTSKVMTEKQRLQQVMNAAQRKAAATRTAQTDDAPFAQSSTAR